MYNVTNLFEDIKTLYKIAGFKGQPVCFLFTDAEVKDEAFLEYINQILMTGEVAGQWAYIVCYLVLRVALLDSYMHCSFPQYCWTSRGPVLEIYAYQACCICGYVTAHTCSEPRVSTA